MYEIFKRTVIISRIYTRYGGDAECMIGLIQDQRDVTFLYMKTQEGHTMQSITSSKDYGDWLFENSMDLMLMLSEESYPHYWWNDRHNPQGRMSEFKKLLEDTNKY